MKRYKLLKKIENKNSINIWDEFEARTVNEKGIAFIDLDDTSSISETFLIQEWYIEAIKEKFIPQWSWKPKFRIWNRIKYFNTFTIITGIKHDKYNWDNDLIHYSIASSNIRECFIKEERLEKPTDEEVDIYY